MFTGIVLERGRLTADPEPSAQGGVRLRLAHSSELGRRLEVGSSLSVAGVCLTVVERAATWVAVELSPETLARTTLGGLAAGAEVNLEPPLRAADPLGGHWVQGHVDSTLPVVERRDLGEHRVLALAAPAALLPYLAEKGSVALDGVSLTISALAGDRFEVALIPHTLEVTTLGALAPGDRVNLEVDILAKYVQRALAERGLIAS
jgi:riboflavin synthase